MKLKAFVLMCAVGLLTTEMSSQVTITNSCNEFLPGTTIYTTVYDSVGAIPKQGGNGVVWDWSNLTSILSNDTTAFKAPSSVSDASLFPTASAFLDDGGDSYTAYKYTAGTGTSSLEWQGDMTMGSIDTKLQNSAVEMIWPMSFGTSNVDTFYESSSNPLNGGTIRLNAIGSGTLMLPGGLKFNNVLLVKRLETIYTRTATTKPFVVLYGVAYAFYTPGVKGHLAMVYYTPFDYTMEVQKISTTGITSYASEKKITVYPNPSNGQVFISGNSGQAASINIHDCSGRLVYSNKDYLLSFNPQPIDANLSPGIYLVSITDATGVISTEKLIIRN